MAEIMIEKLINTLKAIGLEGAKTIEEKLDEQYKALTHLSKKLDEESFLRLVTTNALVSYQLNCKGEIYWWEFAKYFSRNETDFLKFLRASKCNKRLFNTKSRRVERWVKGIEGIKLSRFCDRILDFYKLAYKIMRTNPTSKTIAFSVKMFGYGCRITRSTFFPFPKEVPIPLDSRIKKITSKLTKEDPIGFWFKISRKTSIPCLHIDSILWVTYGLSLDEKVKSVLGPKYKYLEGLKELIS